MDWNGKWDWENLVMFNPNAIDCPRKNQTDWGVEDETATSFGGGVCSGSELGYGSSSARSSTISVSADTSSMINGINVSNPSTVHLSQTEQSGNPRVADGGEPVIGLKLGKRTYFENSSTGSNNATKNASISTPNPVSSVLSTKKIKSCSQRIPSPRCQVEGCNLDLSYAKEYHRKHRVCDAHSKCQKVVVGGLDRRFCQQCSRFHSLSEFDVKKRSCRRRLSEHNARRRKPHQEAIQFSSTRVLTPGLDGGHQISFLLNSTPVLEGRSFEIPLWESSTCSSSSKFMLTKEYPWKSELSFCQGLKKSIPSSSSTSELVLAQDNHSNNSHCALSLLSNNNSCPPQPKQAAKFPFDYPQPLSFPMAAHQYWGEPAHDSAAVLDHGAQFQEIQLLKQQPSYYAADIYSNLLNK